MSSSLLTGLAPSLREFFLQHHAHLAQFAPFAALIESRMRWIDHRWQVDGRYNQSDAVGSVTIDEQEAWERLSRRPPNLTILRGPFASGKTTLLRSFARDFARDGKMLGGDATLLFLDVSPLRTGDNSAVADVVRRLEAGVLAEAESGRALLAALVGAADVASGPIGAGGRPPTEEELEELHYHVAAGHVVVFLDGLDELLAGTGRATVERVVDAILRIAFGDGEPRGHLVLSMRTEWYVGLAIEPARLLRELVARLGLPDVAVVELLRLERFQQAAYIRRALGDDAEQVIDAIECSPALQDLATVPINLVLLCGMAPGEWDEFTRGAVADPCASTYQLFKRYVRTVEADCERAGWPLCSAVVEDHATAVLRQGYDTPRVEPGPFFRGPVTHDPVRALQHLRKVSIFRVIDHTSQGDGADEAGRVFVEFRHRAFAAYFHARRTARLLLSGDEGHREGRELFDLIQLEVEDRKFLVGALAVESNRPGADPYIEETRIGWGLPRNPQDPDPGTEGPELYAAIRRHHAAFIRLAVFPDQADPSGLGAAWAELYPLVERLVHDVQQAPRFVRATRYALLVLSQVLVCVDACEEPKWRDAWDELGARACELLRVGGGPAPWGWSPEILDVELTVADESLLTFAVEVRFLLHTALRVAHELTRPALADPQPSCRSAAVQQLAKQLRQAAVAIKEWNERGASSLQHGIARGAVDDLATSCRIVLSNPALRLQAEGSNP